MIQYVLECMAFQLLFLIAYDLFLKKETFFQWNRVYLLTTFVCAMVLPWIKLEVFETTVVGTKATALKAFFQLDAVIVGHTQKDSFSWSFLTWYEWVFYLGAVVATILFFTKLFKITALKRKGKKKHYANYTLIAVTNSDIAFSFFKNIFLGDRIHQEKHKNVIAHEMVHIKQWHSLDLLLFELLRIVFWFNPLVYLYQSRTSELHEYIADAHVAKNNKEQQYQLLLSEVFQTQHISFVNQFYRNSLVKKRIGMLGRSKSRSILRLKYLVPLPLLFSMLFYAACNVGGESSKGKETVEVSKKEFLNYLKWKEEQERVEHSGIGTAQKIDSTYPIKDGASKIPFALIDKVPVFPGCDNASDLKACFMEKIQEHIRKNFNYPEEAQQLGIQGRVSLMFTIGADGYITNIKKRGPHQSLENEAVRIIEKLPQMTPGLHDGQMVDVPFSIPITFKLN